MEGNVCRLGKVGVLLFSLWREGTHVSPRSVPVPVLFQFCFPKIHVSYRFGRFMIGLRKRRRECAMLEGVMRYDEMIMRR